MLNTLRETDTDVRDLAMARVQAYAHRNALSCGHDSLHPCLEARQESSGRLVLACLIPGCGYRLEDLPVIVS